MSTLALRAAQRQSLTVAHEQGGQEDKKVYAASFPRNRLEEKVTFKVYMILHYEARGVSKIWKSQDKHRNHFPIATLDSASLWEKSRKP